MRFSSRAMRRSTKSRRSPTTTTTSRLTPACGERAPHRVQHFALSTLAAGAALPDAGTSCYEGGVDATRSSLTREGLPPGWQAQFRLSPRTGKRWS